MELVAFFVWPAIAFAVIGWIGFSSLPKRTAVEHPSDVKAIEANREELHRLKDRIQRLEELQKTERRITIGNRAGDTGRLVRGTLKHSARPETRAALSRIVIPAE